MIINIEQPASIKENSGIIIPPLSFFLSFFHAPLSSHSIPPLIYRAHFSADGPGCLLLISPRES